MYFISRNNRLYAQAAHIKPWYRYIILILFIGLLLSGWYKLVYLRLQMSLMQHQQDIQSLHQKHATLCQLDGSCKQVHETLEELKTSINLHKKINNHFVYLLNQVKHTGLDLRSYNNDSTIDKDWYTCTHAQLDLHGSMQQLQKFFEAIKKSNQMIQCDTIRITQVNNANMNAGCQLRLIGIKN